MPPTTGHGEPRQAPPPARPSPALLPPIEAPDYQLGTGRVIGAAGALRPRGAGAFYRAAGQMVWRREGYSRAHGVKATPSEATA